jgi:glycosyltransferase involved in cell wall biosynthesis
MVAQIGADGRRFRSEPMMHLFINSLAASAGGGLTYIRNVIPHLAVTPGLQVSVALGSCLREEFREFSKINFLELEVPPGRRFWFEQSELPNFIQRARADVLLSAGNFALRKPPVPQILLSRNSIYTSSDFYQDLLSRHEYRAYIDTRLRAVLAKRSIRWADATVAPSVAFAAELRRWTGKPVRAIHHGFDRDSFTRDPTPLAAHLEEKLLATEGSLRLLFVSHYNYYRNFETLLGALPLLRDRLNGRSVKLLLTCKLAAGENPGTYNPERAAKLVKELGVQQMLAELGTVPYGQLHHLYRRADVYVTPAYTETFAHPLVEAMASGLPVIASDLDVHREICGEAALYFPRFSSADLAARLAELSRSPEIMKRMAALGEERSRQFSWRTHVDELLKLSDMLIASNARSAANKSQNLASNSLCRDEADKMS